MTSSNSSTTAVTQTYAHGGWKYDRKLTATMIEEMIFDPILASKIIYRIRVPPHEELRFLIMWTTFRTNDDSGFSTGKSFTHAVIAGLRSILFPGRTSGIISKTFEQGKLIFQYFDRWYDRSPIFKWCVAHHGKSNRLLHGNSVHQAFFRGGSEVRVLPPNFAQDAERMRSERWNDGYFDEWTTYGNMEAFNKTLIGRVTKENDYPDCPIRQNHIHSSSTPGFKWQPCYSEIRKMNQLIASGNSDYARFTCNYRHIPKTKEWGNLINRKVILNMQTSLPKGIVASEVDGVWQDDSLSFYSASDIEKVRQSSVIFSPSQKQMEDYLFVMGFDVARGGGSQSGRQGNDDFALSVLAIPRAEHISNKAIHCFSTRRNNITAEQMGGIVQYYRRVFNPSFIAYDTGGGGFFVADELKKDYITINNVLTKVEPLVEYGDTTPFALPILLPFRRTFYFIASMWGKMNSESVMLNRLHASFISGIQSSQVSLGRRWDGWETIGSQWDVDQKREWLNRKPSISEADRAGAEMDLAVDQLIMVDVERDDGNKPKLDSYGMYKFKSRFKKDCAYGLVYSYLGFMVQQHMSKLSGQEGGNSVATASASEITINHYQDRRFR